MATFQEILRRRLKELKTERKAVLAGELPSIVPTGLRELDKRGGHKRKILTVYGAATGDGKSLWKLHLMRAAAKAGLKVFVLDFEDPESLTADREFANATGINSALLSSGGVEEKHLKQMALALTESEEWAGNVQVELGVKTAEEALELLNGQEADLVLVDYLSALPHGKHGRERAISDFCWAITKYAQDHNAAVIAFSQLVAEVSDRGMRMYEMARKSAQYRNDGAGAKPYIEGFRGFDNNDLAWAKDSGKTAKELGFLFRPGRYYKRLDPKTTEKDDRMEINYTKRNFGAEGRITVGLDLKTARFYDLPEGKA